MQNPLPPLKRLACIPSLRGPPRSGKQSTMSLRGISHTLLAPVLTAASLFASSGTGATPLQENEKTQTPEIHNLFSLSELTDACWSPGPTQDPLPPPRCQDQGNTFLPLSPLDEARTLIVGYHRDSEDFIEDLARALLEEEAARGIRLLVLVPAGQLARTRKALDARTAARRLLAQRRLDLRSAANPNNTWLQDAMEIGWSPATGSPLLYDLPHFESDRAGQSLASTCGLDRIDPAANRSDISRDRSQNHGGNWEGLPGGLVMTLHGATPALIDDFTRQSPNISRIELRAEWLEVGHIDELFSIVPIPADGRADACAFALAAASPALALKLARQGQGSIPLEPQLSHANPRERPLNKERLGCIAELHSSATGTPLKAKEALRCKALKRANQEFEGLIQEELTRLLGDITRATGCDSIPVIHLPVLFKPGHKMSKDAFARAQKLKHPPRTPWSGARAINPNPINGISLNSLLLVPEQSHPGFSDAIRERIGAVAPGLTARFIATPHVHFLGGEAHCGTNVIRSCTSPL